LPEVFFTVIWGFILANCFMGGIAAVMARTMAYVTLFPRGLLAPIIMIFCVVGTFAASGNPWDVWIMITMGIIGYFAHKYNFAPAGILLGIILGPIAEEGLRNVLLVSDDSPFSFIFSRWISDVIIFMIIVAFYYAFKPQAWDKAVEEGEAKLAAGDGEKDA